VTRTVQLGPFGGLRFPIGDLMPGRYTVTATLPDQGQFLATSATGTLHVDGSFTESLTGVLPAAPATFALVLQHSIAGPGAGLFGRAKTAAGGIALSGTEYYACGTIEVSIKAKLGKQGRVTGTGSVEDGTGNYDGLSGAFSVKGSYRPKTGRINLSLAGALRF
jgi:hypothetical protein